MHEIIFYQDAKGRKPTKEFIDDLDCRDDKNSIENSDKIYDYMDILRDYGFRGGMPYMRHLDGEIWELRPKRNRLLFAKWNRNTFIILHHFLKTTQKTPHREIEKAKRNLADYRERNNDYD